MYGGTPVRWVVRHKPRTVYCVQGEGPIRREAVSLIPGTQPASRRGLLFAFCYCFVFLTKLVGGLS